MAAKEVCENVEVEGKEEEKGYEEEEEKEEGGYDFREEVELVVSPLASDPTAEPS